ncbi:MAG: hypothetical protein ACI87E_001860 [Mariniblastus sp.]|jgi:hypothetical protein
MAARRVSEEALRSKASHERGLSLADAFGLWLPPLNRAFSQQALARRVATVRCAKTNVCLDAGSRSGCRCLVFLATDLANLFSLECPPFPPTWITMNPMTSAIADRIIDLM